MLEESQFERCASFLLISVGFVSIPSGHCAADLIFSPRAGPVGIPRLPLCITALVYCDPACSVNHKRRYRDMIFHFFRLLCTAPVLLPFALSNFTCL